MSILFPMLSTPAGSYNPNAVKFDGTNDYLTRGADLTGIANSKSGIFSCWIRLDGKDGSSEMILSNLASAATFQVYKGSGNKIVLVGSTALGINTSSLQVASPRWVHILASWDQNVTTQWLYVNDTADITSTTNANSTISYITATPNWAVGGNTDASTPFDGALAELYFAPGQYLDFSVTANRRKFIDANGLPVSLGATGSTPTGSQPAIYLNGSKSSFGTNAGSGGNFTLTGALETASQAPSIPWLGNNPATVSSTTAFLNAVKYDGSTGYLTRGAALTGVADGTTGILSCWVRQDALGVILLSSTSNTEFVGCNNNPQVVLYNTSSAVGILLQSSSTPPANQGWIHILAAWDIATAGNNKMYLNGVDVTTLTTRTAGTNLAYATGQSNWAIGANVSGGGKVSSAIAEFYFAPNQWLDLTNSANRAKFIDASGNPVYLGTGGSLPTGTAPAIYLNQRAALIGTNAGTGGNFTVNGTVVDANSTPLYYYSEPSQSWSASNYMGRGGTLTGVVNGSLGTFSGWVRFDGGNGVEQWLMGTNTPNFSIRKTTANKIGCQLNDGAGNYSYWDSSGTYTSGTAVWHHIALSWDTNHAAGGRLVQMYIDGVSASPTESATGGNAFNVHYNDTNIGVGSSSGGAYPVSGAISDIYLNTVAKIDLSVPANLAYFMTATIRPVFLGKDGSLPTGSQPAVYLANPYSSFQTNLGSGGNFTVTGALGRGTTSASDVQYP